jgi:hypothetical protein
VVYRRLKKAFHLIKCGGGVRNLLEIIGARVVMLFRALYPTALLIMG